jgi:hypothetical protein
VRDAPAVVDHKQMYYAQNLQTKIITQRILRRVISYVVVLLLAAVLLQVFTPFPVLTWLSELTKRLNVGQYWDGCAASTVKNSETTSRLSGAEPSQS